jgi:hypothetical protein
MQTVVASLSIFCILSFTTACTQATSGGSDEQIDVQVTRDAQLDYRARVQLIGACSLVPLTGTAWVDSKMAMLNGEAGAAQITKDAHDDFVEEVERHLNALDEIGPVALPGDEARETPLVEEIQIELLKVKLRIADNAEWNQSGNGLTFPAYFPAMNNASFLDDLIDVCGEFDRLPSS